MDGQRDRDIDEQAPSRQSGQDEATNHHSLFLPGPRDTQRLCHHITSLDGQGPCPCLSPKG